MRATRNEVSDLIESDPHWWPGFCADVAERGREALKAERDARGWSWGALWKFIIDNPELQRDYQSALEAYAQDKALETIGIADGASAEDVSVAKLQIDTRLKVAGKVDRGRWGEQVTHNVVVDSFGEMLRRVSERKLAALKAEQSEVIDVTPELVPRSLIEPKPALVAYETLEEI